VFDQCRNQQFDDGVSDEDLSGGCRKAVGNHPAEQARPAAGEAKAPGAGPTANIRSLPRGRG